MATSYFDRYSKGDHLGVCRELTLLGRDVRDPPVYEDARRVAREVVRRALVNFLTLHGRLCDLGYQFANPEAALKLASPLDEHDIRAAEAELGTFPIIVRAWYETISSLDFSQADAQLRCASSEPPLLAPDAFGLGSHPVCVFRSLAQCREEANRFQTAARGPRFLASGAWTSGCDPKGFDLPSFGFDAPYDRSEPDHLFVDELRSLFNGGGFPFWMVLLENDEFAVPFTHRPRFGKLLPRLREGLLDL